MGDRGREVGVLSCQEPLGGLGQNAPSVGFAVFGQRLSRISPATQHDDLRISGCRLGDGAESSSRRRRSIRRLRRCAHQRMGRRKQADRIAPGQMLDGLRCQPMSCLDIGREEFGDPEGVLPRAQRLRIASRRLGAPVLEVVARCRNISTVGQCHRLGEIDQRGPTGHHAQSALGQAAQPAQIARWSARVPERPPGRATPSRRTPTWQDRHDRTPSQKPPVVISEPYISLMRYGTTPDGRHAYSQRRTRREYASKSLLNLARRCDSSAGI